VFVGEGRAEGEKFVAARVAAERGETEQAANEGEEARDLFGWDAAKVGVAAVAAMSVEGEAKGDGAGVETLFAGFAAPRENFGTAEEIVN